MESLVVVVAQKIVFALASEAVASVSPGESLEREEATQAMSRIKSEFEHIREFINNVDPQRYSATLEQWKQRARELADRMEDVIDEYLYHSTMQPRFMLPTITVNGFSFHMGGSTWRLINDQLQQIAKDLDHLGRMKERYDIMKPQSEKEGESASSTTDAQHSSNQSGTNTPKEDGCNIFAEEKKRLILLLTDKREALTLISVHGMPGQGKTFMVQEVRNHPKLYFHFDCTSWVSISKPYRIDHVLKEIYRGLQDFGAEKIEGTSLNELVDNIWKFLWEKKYLIILDDVQNPKTYDDVKRALPDDGKGSRIVITTRSDEVAQLANQGYRMKLGELKPEEAWDLFCKEAFCRDEDKTCPDNLTRIGMDIVGKCARLPLAIVHVARRLSLKNKTEPEWRRFLEKLNWEFPDSQSSKDVDRVLKTSYDDLPSHLKNCFLYCSMFPGYNIKRKKLIRLWIAESFIQEKGTQTMEEVAEDFLQELLQRSVVQVQENNSFGRTKCLLIHNLVGDLAIAKARKENFSFVCKNSVSAHSGNAARRLSVHGDFPKVLCQMDFSGTRSLFVFDNASTSLTGPLEMISSRAKYLRIADLEDSKIDRIPDAFTNLFNLHYLGLRNTGIKRLPNSIWKLRNLQTLDLRYTKIEKLPKGINQLKNMRHLLTLNKNPEKISLHLNSVRCARVPKGIGELTSLQQLDMAVDEASVRRLGQLTQLRVLKLSNVREAHHQALTESISQMPALRNLWMMAEDENEVLPWQDLGEFFWNLKKLHLHGRLLAPTAVHKAEPRSCRRRLLITKFKTSVAATKRICWWRKRRSEDQTRYHLEFRHLRWFVLEYLMENLQELCLSWSRLRENPLPELNKLRQLTVLKLRRAYDGLLLCFQEGWFPQLKDLHLLRLPNLRKIVFERGSLARLQVLSMEGLLELATIPQGIERLSSLRALHLSECNSIFIHEIKGDPKGSVAHIARIIYRHQADGNSVLEELSRRDAGQQQQPLNSPRATASQSGAGKTEAPTGNEAQHEEKNQIRSLELELAREKEKRRALQTAVQHLYGATSVDMPSNIAAVLEEEKNSTMPSDEDQDSSAEDHITRADN